MSDVNGARVKYRRSAGNHPHTVNRVGYKSKPRPSRAAEPRLPNLIYFDFKVSFRSSSMNLNIVHFKVYIQQLISTHITKLGIPFMILLSFVVLLYESYRGIKATAGSNISYQPFPVKKKVYTITWPS